MARDGGLPLPERRQGVHEGGSGGACFKRLREGRSPDAEGAKEREVAVQRWRSTFSDVGPWCDFARSLEDGGDSFSQSVVDVLATRMTATLL